MGEPEQRPSLRAPPPLSGRSLPQSWENKWLLFWDQDPRGGGRPARCPFPPPPGCLLQRPPPTLTQGSPGAPANPLFLSDYPPPRPVPGGSASFRPGSLEAEPAPRAHSSILHPPPPPAPTLPFPPSRRGPAPSRGNSV